MQKIIFISVIILLSALVTVAGFRYFTYRDTAAGAPPYDTAFDDPPQEDNYFWLKDWQRPDGPVRVGIQVGHWKNDELPDELERLRGNTGSSGGGKAEWEVNLGIAQEAAKILRAKNILVDIIPSTVPEQYLADAFIAIHADGNSDTSVSGYKLASPRRDYSGKAANLADSVLASYGQEVKMAQDPNVSRNMRGYYAFAWWRHRHAVHPMTPAIILETGFLTNSSDRRYIVDTPEVPALGLANGIIGFLIQEKLIPGQSEI